MSAVQHQSTQRAERDEFVLAALRQHAASMLSLARRHSLCADDAQDAYQRTVEILLRRADSLDPASVGGWLRTVVKHEAMAVRAQRAAAVPEEDVDFDAQPGEAPTEEERVVRFDRLAQAAEALQRLKPDEARALVLLGHGHSYREISRLTGWTHTKVNRLVTEGRRTLVARYDGIEAGRECERWSPLLARVADGEASARELLAVRPHLRRCAACRAVVRAHHEAPRRVAALVPLGAGLALATGAPARSGELPSFLARLHDALAAGVHERLAASAQRAQSMIEAATTGKAAALAASTVALAGGGIVAGRALVDPPRRPPILHAAATSPARAGHRHTPRHRAPAASVRPSFETVASVRRSTAPAKTGVPAHETHVTRRHSTLAAASEFSADGAADAGAQVAPRGASASGSPPARTSPATAPAAQTASAAAGGEFGP